MYQIYQVIRTAGIWLGTKRKSAHINSTQMVLSMCSSRYCSTFATHFFLYFRAIIVFFWILWLFHFIFWYFFFTYEHKRSNHRKYELKQVKDVACGKFRRRAQNWQKAYDHEKRILWPVFCQNKNFQTQQSWISIPSICLSCWPIHVPSTRCIKWFEQQKYG